MLAKAGSFNTGTTLNNTVEVTVGFQPKVIFFFWNGRTESTDAAGRATHLRGFGYAVSTTNRGATGQRSADAAAAAVADSRNSVAACILECGDGAIAGLVDLDAILSDGFRTIIDDALTVDLRVGYLALGGDDLTNVAAGQSTLSSGVDLAVTGQGFAPDAVLLFSGQVGAGGLDSTYSLGAMKSTTEQFAITGGSNDAATSMQTMAYGYGTEALAMMANNLVSVNGRYDFGSLDAGGFTLNFLEGTRTDDVFWVMLKCTAAAQIQIKALLTKTDGTDIVVATTGQTPKALLFASVTRAESTVDTSTDHDSWSVGAATSPTERIAHGVRDQDAAADAVVTTAIEHDAVYVRLDGTGVVGLMDLKSIEAEGFTCVMDDVDPDAAAVWAISFGDPPAGGAFTLSADPGSYAITGQAAGVSAGRKLAATAGSYVLTGQAAGVRAGRRLSAAAGAYVITGQAATLTYGPAAGGFTLSADPGVYTVTGQAATLRATRKIAAVAGSYALTGQSAGVAVGRRLSAVAGGYTITGQSATFRSTRTLTAAPGSYSVTGSAATFVWSGTVVQAAEAEYVIQVRADVGVIRVRPDVGIIEIT